MFTDKTRPSVAGLFGFAVAATAALAFTAPADALLIGSDDDWRDRFERLEQEVHRLREENQQQQTEISALRRQVDVDWLTEERAAEIRALVDDVLADADVRSSLLHTGMTAGWTSEDGFFLADPNGRFAMHIGGQLQVRYVANRADLPDTWRRGFENTRTRLTVRGHVFNRDLTYLVRGRFQREGGGGVEGQGGQRTDIGGDFRLQDAWIRWNLNNEWSLRIGQFKLPFNREELVSSEHQLAVERSHINEVMNLGRSQGVELVYHDNSIRWAFAFSDGATDTLIPFGNLIGTSPANTPALFENTEYSFTTRLDWLVAGRWSQFIDFTSPADDDFGLLVGVGGHFQRAEFGTPTPDRQWAAYTVDVSAEFGGANLFASFFHHYADSRLAVVGPLNYFGVVVQGGYYVMPKTELFGRFEYGKVKRGLGEPQFDSVYFLTVGSNYYFDGHDAKFTIDFGYAFNNIESLIWARTGEGGITGWRADNPNSSSQMILRMQMQLLF